MAQVKLKFKKGDLVRLKCGGPKMKIVTHTFEALERKTLENKFDCVWHENDGDPATKTYHGEFYDYTLAPVELLQ